MSSVDPSLIFDGAIGSESYLVIYAYDPIQNTKTPEFYKIISKTIVCAVASVQPTYSEMQVSSITELTIKCPVPDEEVSIGISFLSSSASHAVGACPLTGAVTVKRSLAGTGRQVASPCRSDRVTGQLRPPTECVVLGGLHLRTARDKTRNSSDVEN